MQGCLSMRGHERTIVYVFMLCKLCADVQLRSNGQGLM
jgi:hypothetical protein